MHFRINSRVTGNYLSHWTSCKIVRFHPCIFDFFCGQCKKQTIFCCFLGRGGLSPVTNIKCNSKHRWCWRCASMVWITCVSFYKSRRKYKEKHLIYCQENPSLKWLWNHKFVVEQVILWSGIVVEATRDATVETKNSSYWHTSFYKMYLQIEF